MSLGFIPLLITVVLCLFIAQDIAVYIGTSIGALASLLSVFAKKPIVPKYILFMSTAILLTFTIATFIYSDYCPYGYLPLTIEISTFVMMAVLFMHKGRFIKFIGRRQSSCSKRFYVQGAESAIVSSRIYLLVAGTHLLSILIFLLFADTFLNDYHTLINRYSPSIVFIITILFNQIAILYFNKITANMEFVPVVNKQGAVIGKKIALEAINYNNEYINPVIRIAAISNGKVYLCRRSQNCIIDRDKMDIPMECYLKYGEKIEDGANRLIRNAFPKISDINPFFNIKYHFENEYTNRLIYLFILDTDQPEFLENLRFKEGRLWTLEEIDAQLDKDTFSECFKNEYEHLKELIYIREKYREL